MVWNIKKIILQIWNYFVIHEVISVHTPTHCYQDICSLLCSLSLIRFSSVYKFFLLISLKNINEGLLYHVDLSEIHKWAYALLKLTWIEFYVHCGFKVFGNGCRVYSPKARWCWWLLCMDTLSSLLHIAINLSSIACCSNCFCFIFVGYLPLSWRFWCVTSTWFFTDFSRKSVL